MGSGASLPTDVHVVIVGGGYAGAELALGLKKGGAKYTLIDKRDAFQHTIGAVRAFVKPGFCNKIYIPFKDTFGDRFVQGAVTKIDPQNKQVHLQDSRVVAYDVLVIATGAECPFPAQSGKVSTAESNEAYGQYLERLKRSEKIAVVGGGPVGVEICGEIATEYPNKKVTLVHSRDWLVTEETNKKFQKNLMQMLSQLKVECVLGQKVTNLADVTEEGPVTLKTDKGREVHADMVIVCTGQTKINSDAYRDGLGDAMDERGQLKVNETLQVQDHPDVFAIGDCCNFEKDKLASLAMYSHAPLMLENLKLRQAKKTLKKCKPNNKPMVIGVSVGRNHGLCQLNNGMLLPEFIMKSNKSKDLLVKTTWSKFGQKVPKD